MDKRRGMAKLAAMADHIPEEHKLEFERLKNGLPQGTEMARLLASTSDPASDEASKDRYIALVAGNAVQGALKAALGFGPEDRKSFDQLIKKAKEVGLVTEKRGRELDRIREIRNLFAHAMEPISFSNPAVSAVTKLLFHHPVTCWSSYFAPIFDDRVKFAIVCGEFFKSFMRGGGPTPPQ